MKQTATVTPQREAQVIDKESVKTLAIAIGVRNAARKLGLDENRVLKWSERGKWFKAEPKPQPPTVTQNDVISVIKPSDALAQTLSDDSNATKIGFSRAARKVSQHLAEGTAKALVRPATAISASKWATVAGQVHGWQESKRDEGGLVAIQLIRLELPQAQEIIEMQP
jgi:hypothetical protein